MILEFTSEGSDSYPEVPNPGEIVSLNDKMYDEQSSILRSLRDFEFYYLFGHESRNMIEKAAWDYGFENKIKNLRYKTFDLVSKSVVEERLNILLKRTRKQKTNPTVVMLCKLSIERNKQHVDLVLDSDWEQSVLEKRTNRLLSKVQRGNNTLHEDTGPYYFDHEKVPRTLPLYLSGELKLQTEYSIVANRCQLYVSWELALLISFMYRLYITVFDKYESFKKLNDFLNLNMEQNNNVYKENNSKTTKKKEISVNSPFLPIPERFPSAIINNLTLLVILNKYATPFATAKQLIFNNPSNFPTPEGSLFYIPYGLNIRTGIRSGTAFYKQFSISTDDFLNGCTRIFLGKTAIFNTLPSMRDEMIKCVHEKWKTWPNSLSYVLDEKSNMNNPVLPVDIIKNEENGKIVGFEQPHKDLSEIPAVGHINLPLLIYEKTHFIKSYCYYFGNYVYNSSLTGFDSMKALGQYLPVIVAGKPVPFFNLTIGILDKLYLEQAENRTIMRLESLTSLRYIFRDQVFDKLRTAVFSYYEVTNNELKAIKLMKEIKADIIRSRFKHPLLDFNGKKSISEFGGISSEKIEIELKNEAVGLWKEFHKVVVTEWLAKPKETQKKRPDYRYRMSSCVKGPGIFKLSRDGREFNQVARTFVNYAEKHWKPIVVPSLPYDQYYKTRLKQFDTNNYPILPPISVPMVVEFSKLSIKHLIPYCFPLLSTTGEEYENTDNEEIIRKNSSDPVINKKNNNCNLLEKADEAYYDESENYLSYKEWLTRINIRNVGTEYYDRLIDYETLPFKIIIHDGSVQIDVLRIFPATNIYASDSSDGVLNQLLRPKLTPMTSNCSVLTLQKNLGPVWGRYGVYIKALDAEVEFKASIITLPNIINPHSTFSSISIPKALGYLSYTFEELFIRMAANPSVFQIAKFPVGVFSFGRTNMIRITSDINIFKVKMTNAVDHSIKTLISAENFSFSHHNFASNVFVKKIDITADDKKLLPDTVEINIPETKICLKYCCDEKRLKKSLLVFHPSTKIESDVNHISLEYMKHLYVRWRCIMNIGIKDKIMSKFGTNLTFASYLSLLMEKVAHKGYFNIVFGMLKILDLNSSPDPTIVELCILKREHEPKHGVENYNLREWAKEMLIEGFRIEDVILDVKEFQSDVTILNNAMTVCFHSTLKLDNINICFDLFYNFIKFGISISANGCSVCIKNIQIITVYKTILQDNSHKDYLSDHNLIDNPPYVHPNDMMNEIRIDSIESVLKVDGLFYLNLIVNSLGMIFRGLSSTVPGYPVYPKNDGLTPLFETYVEINSCSIQFDGYGNPNRFYLVNLHGNKLALSNRVKKSIDIGAKLIFETSYKRDLILAFTRLGYEKKDLTNSAITDRLTIIMDPIIVSLAPQELFIITVVIQDYLFRFSQINNNWGDDMERANMKIMNNKLYNRLYYCLHWLNSIDANPDKKIKTNGVIETYTDEYKKSLIKREMEHDSRIAFKPFNHSFIFQIPSLILSIPATFSRGFSDTLSYGLLVELSFVTVTLNTLKSLFKKENFDKIIHNNFTFSLSVQKIKVSARIAPESFNEFSITDKNIEETISRIYMAHLMSKGKKLTDRIESEIRDTISFYSSVLPPLVYRTILTSDIPDPVPQVTYYFNTSSGLDNVISLSYVGTSDEIYNSLTSSVKIERSIDYCKVNVKPLYIYLEEGLSILVKYTIDQLNKMNSENSRKKTKVVREKSLKKMTEPIQIKYFELFNVNLRMYYNKSQNFLAKQHIERNSYNSEGIGRISNTRYINNNWTITKDNKINLFKLYKNIEWINITCDYPTRISLGFSTLSGTKIMLNNVIFKPKNSRYSTYSIADLSSLITDSLVADVKNQLPFLFMRAPLRIIDRQFNARYKVKRETYKHKKK